MRRKPVVIAVMAFKKIQSDTGKLTNFYLSILIYLLSAIYTYVLVIINDYGVRSSE